MIPMHSSELTIQDWLQIERGLRGRLHQEIDFLRRCRHLTPGLLPHRREMLREVLDTLRRVRSRVPQIATASDGTEIADTTWEEWWNGADMKESFVRAT